MQESLLAYKRFMDLNDLTRADKQEKQYNYYIGNEDAILEYLDETLAISFSSESIADMIKHYINLVKKVIDQLSILYNKSASRTILIDGVPNEQLTNVYNSVLPNNINSVDKLALRLAKLSNVSFTRVYFDKKYRKIAYRVEPAHKIRVVNDPVNVNRIDLLSYDYYIKDEKGEDEKITVVWTEEEHFRLDKNDNAIPVGDNFDMVNPYKDKYGNGVIPFAILRINESEDFWGEGQDDLVNFNEIINVMLTDLLNSGVILSSYGTPVAINMGLEYRTESGEFIQKKIKTGPKYPLVVENARSTEMVSPSLEYIKPDSILNEIRDIIDWHIKLIAVTKGLNPNSLVMETKSTSGYSKIMDALEEIHIREDIIEQARTYEKERFEITKSVINAHAAEIGFSIPDNAELKVNYSEVNIPKTVQELWLDREMNYKYNLQKPADWLMEDDKDLDVEDANYRIEQNSIINKSNPINEFSQAQNVEQTELKTQI